MDTDLGKVTAKSRLKEHGEIKRGRAAPRKDSDDDNANVSVIELASANLSHSFANVTYVGVMYCEARV